MGSGSPARHGSAPGEAAAPRLGYCPGGRGPPGCPEPRSGSGSVGGGDPPSPLPNTHLYTHTHTPHRGVGPVRGVGWAKGLTGCGSGVCPTSGGVTGPLHPPPPPPHHWPPLARGSRTPRRDWPCPEPAVAVTGAVATRGPSRKGRSSGELERVQRHLGAGRGWAQAGAESEPARNPPPALPPAAWDSVGGFPACPPAPLGTPRRLPWVPR